MLGKWTPKNVLIVAGVAAVGAWYIKRRAGEALKTVGEAVDITSNTNLASRGAEAWWGGGSDGRGTIGTDAYDWIHSPDRWWN